MRLLSGWPRNGRIPAAVLIILAAASLVYRYARNAWAEDPACQVTLNLAGAPEMKKQVARKLGESVTAWVTHPNPGYGDYAALGGMSAIDPAATPDPFFSSAFGFDRSAICKQLGIFPLWVSCDYGGFDEGKVFVVNMTFTHGPMPTIPAHMASIPMVATVSPGGILPYLSVGGDECGIGSTCTKPSADVHSILINTPGPSFHSNGLYLAATWDGQVSHGDWYTENDFFLNGRVRINLPNGPQNVGFEEPRAGIFQPAHSLRTTDITCFRDDVVPGQWLPVECLVRWSSSMGFSSPQISWTCSKGSFANPSAAATTYAAAGGQTGADTLHVVLDEPARGMHAEISKTVTIWPDHLARDYGNMNTLNQWAAPNGLWNCQYAANHAWTGDRDIEHFSPPYYPPWKPEKPFQHPDYRTDPYKLVFQRQPPDNTFETYQFVRGSVVCVGMEGYGTSDVKTVLENGTGGVTPLFGKGGSGPWVVIHVEDLVGEGSPYDWMYVAEQ